MCKLGVRLFLFNLILFSALIPNKASAQHRQRPAEEGTEAEEHEAEPYSESALRRFEIITLSSLPFTAIHSYGVTRLIKMWRENQFAPELSTRDYRIIGAGAVSLSLFIGFWDWLHTRDVDRSAPRVPESHTPPPSEEEEPVEGTLARVSETSPYLLRSRHNGQQDVMNRGLNGWANEQPIGFVMPLIQIRF